MDPFDLPLLNTLILLCSGTTVTWAHHSLIHGDREGLKTGLWLTILLGLLFTSWSWLILGLVVAVAGGFYNWNKVQKIVNHRDNQ